MDSNKPYQQGVGGSSGGEAEIQDVENVAKILSPYWGLYLLRGLIVTFFGLFFLLSPARSIAVIAKVFGSLLIIEGVMHLFKVCMYRNTTPTMTFTSISTDNITYFASETTNTHGSTMLCAHCLSCVINVVLGILIFTHPFETAGAIMVFVAIWFILIGFLQILLARSYHLAGDDDYRGGGGFDWVMLLVGVCYVILGTFFLFHLFALIPVIGMLVTIFGVQLVYIAIKLRALYQKETSVTNEQQQPLQEPNSSVV